MSDIWICCVYINRYEERELLFEMTVSIKNKKLICLLAGMVFLILFTASAFIRKPYDGEGFTMSDATYHVLLTMQAYSETPASTHEFLPIQTYGPYFDKYIDNGPSLIQDELGNSYYVSFSPIGFYTPYLFCRLFHLSLSVRSLYIFNTLLMLCCAIIIGTIMFFLFDNLFLAIVSAMAYSFLPEVLYTQGIVYWNHSLSQLFLLFQTLLFVLIFIKGRNKVPFYILFFIVSFLYPYSEWTGFVSNIGMALAILILDFKLEKQENKSKRCSLSVSGLISIILLALITIGAMGYYIYRFARKSSVTEVIQTMAYRAVSRSKATFADLIKGYFVSFMPIIIIVALLLIIVLLVEKSRKTFKDMFLNKVNFVIILILLFPLVENAFMTGHAIAYTFDRLKGASIFVYLLIMELMALKQVLNNKYIIVPAICVALIAVIGLSTYSRGKIVTMSDYNDTLVMKKYLEDNYISDGRSVFVKKGWRAWGYLQSLYHRNLYCTALYSYDTLCDIANSTDNEYIVCIESSSVRDDTAVYSDAEIVNVNTAECIKVHIEEGNVIREDVNSINAVALNDSNYTNGINNSDPTEICFENNLINNAKLQNASSILVGSDEYGIVGIDSDMLWIRVHVDKDAGKCAYPSVLTVK